MRFVSSWQQLAQAVLEIGAPRVGQRSDVDHLAQADGIGNLRQVQLQQFRNADARGMPFDDGDRVTGGTRLAVAGASKRIDIWPNNPIPGNPNFVKGDFRGDGRNALFWQRFRIESDGTGTIAFPDEVFHMFDFMGTGNDQIITVSRNGTVSIYGYKGAKSNPTPEKKDPLYRAHSISNHTHY